MTQAPALTKRNPIVVVALAFVTFTIYAYYWLYKTTEELKEEADRDDLHPVLDVVLALATFGLWGLWAGYRNARVAHELFDELGARHTDRALAVGAFGIASLFTGWTWLISMGLLQDDLNRLADECVATDTLFAESAPRPPVQTRVAVEAPAQPVSRWEDAPGAPVFESNAPPPVVF